MSDTSKRGVPVRFRIMPGGTNPAAVVSLAEVLATLIEPHLTADERRIREGLPVVDDYDWGYPQGDTEGSVDPDSAGVHEAPSANTALPAAAQPSPVSGMTASGDSSADSELAPREPENPGETNTTTPAVVPPETRETPATGTPRVKEILVPITPGTSPEQAKRDIQRRLKGPLPARCDLIMQTSGSQTGTGHLVAISAAALVSSARSTLAMIGEGRWILALPVNHIGGLQVLTRSLIAGTKPVIVDTTSGFNPKQLVRAVERATSDPGIPAYISLVPTQVSRILDEGGEPVEALAKLHTILVGGAAFTTFLADRAKAAGWHVVETYGMTETCGGCVYDGMPLVGTQVSTVGDTVWITGTTLMEDYLEIPAPGEETPWIQMGPRRWFKTSDTGRMEGPRLIIQGRTDDVINTGGVKVHASAVEEAALTVPGVGRICVVGLPDARWGELVTALVVPGQDVDVDLLAPLMGSPASLGVRGADGQRVEPDSLAARIRTAVGAELGAAHAPRVIIIVQQLPLLGPGKVDRHEAAAIAQRELRAGRAWVR
ncbi:AMP-binding protein [Mobiluncus mulieris]